MGREFRKQFLAGLRRLVLKGELRLEDKWSKLKAASKLDAWIDELNETDWNVFIEGPPNGRSKPTHVLKYLARYMTGGPISDQRLISDEDGRVRFWARSKDKSKGIKPRPFSLRAVEFVRRWSMHILPKGYTRSRSYGGYHGTKRRAYLEYCRELLDIAPETDELSIDSIEVPDRASPTCDHCETILEIITQESRPSWRDIFERDIYLSASIYSPIHHLHFGKPPAHSVDEYG